MKRLHTNKKIFFKNAYILRLEFPPECTYEQATFEFGKLNRRAYKSLSGTWGFSTINTEEIRKFDMDELFKVNDPYTRYRGYLCFADEIDALHYRLTVTDKAQRVIVWPDRVTFTIHEVVETDES